MEGTKFVHIQVKTYVPGSWTCSVGRNLEKFYGENFFWILGGGIPKWGSDDPFEYYIIPSAVMAKNVKEKSDHWTGWRLQARMGASTRTAMFGS